jgi:hypothetical protein
MHDGQEKDEACDGTEARSKVACDEDEAAEGHIEEKGSPETQEALPVAHLR